MRNNDLRHDDEKSKHFDHKNITVKQDIRQNSKFYPKLDNKRSKNNYRFQGIERINPSEYFCCNINKKDNIKRSEIHKENENNNNRYWLSGIENITNIEKYDNLNSHNKGIYLKNDKNINNNAVINSILHDYRSNNEKSKIHMNIIQDTEKSENVFKKYFPPQTKILDKRTKSISLKIQMKHYKMLKKDKYIK